MENLKPADLLELILLSEASIDYQVEFWLTVSFAAVVACFAAGDLLTKKMRWLISFLYLIATVVFASRWYYNAVEVLAYVEALKAQGVDIPVGYVSGVSRMVLFGCGTLATIFFLNLNSKIADV